LLVGTVAALLIVSLTHVQPHTHDSRGTVTARVTYPGHSACGGGCTS
jgi:hypothetical protein